MTSKFARSDPTPGGYDWCKKVITPSIPHPGDPWPPYFSAYVSYETALGLPSHIQAFGQTDLLRLPGPVKYQATVHTTIAGVKHSAQVTMTYYTTTGLWTFDVFAYKPGWAGTPLACYQIAMPDPFNFKWQAPPWDWDPGNVHTKILRIKS